jgi:acetolactate synthase-1/2/3 large subunit
MSTQQTVAQVLAEAFKRHGVRHVFGMPGGGSSLDIIRACHELGIDFILVRAETPGAIMAAATAELSGGFGVVITTQGPGTASATNGVAYAAIDRTPLIIISDGWTEKQSHDTHQRFDQKALLAPLTKAHTRLDGDDVANEVEALIRVIMTEPHGPAYIELTGEAARRVVDHTLTLPPAPKANGVDKTLVAQARAKIAAARKPLMLVGLEARDPALASGIAAMARELACPVFTTYKAKGVVPDEMPNLVGLFTGAAAEKDCVSQADLMICVGFDPVELIGRPWPYKAEVIDIAPVRHPINYFTPSVAIYHPLAATIDALRGNNRPSEWKAEEIAQHRDVLRERLIYPAEKGALTPDSIVGGALALAKGRNDIRIAVDAGAHMVSSMAVWRSKQAGDTLISNGLSTMAFALPAAIGAALHEPARRVIAFTGDGGLMMCIGELGTAAQYRTKICVVVFNDGALSMIGLKQKARKLPNEGVEWPKANFAQVAEGFGVKGFRADTLAQYTEALRVALAHDGPSLIDVAIDPSGYSGQLAALRG